MAGKRKKPTDTKTQHVAYEVVPPHWGTCNKVRMWHKAAETFTAAALTGLLPFLSLSLFKGSYLSAAKQLLYMVEYIYIYTACAV